MITFSEIDPVRSARRLGYDITSIAEDPTGRTLGEPYAEDIIDITVVIQERSFRSHFESMAVPVIVP
jgi:hypothetical protein